MFRCSRPLGNLDGPLIGLSMGVTFRLELQGFIFFFILPIVFGIYHFYSNDNTVNDLSIKHTPDWKGGFWLTAGDSCAMGAGW